MKDYQENLAKVWNYKKLPDKVSQDVRRKYMFEIPKFLKLNGDSMDIYSKETGTFIMNGYDRIVVGDYGAFIEFDSENIQCMFTIPDGQQWRTDIGHNSKYVWLWPYDCIPLKSTVDKSCKIYHQKSRVDYADYIPGKYYVSVHDVKIKDNED